MNQQTLSAFIWSVADLLRGDYKQSDYGKVKVQLNDLFDGELSDDDKLVYVNNVGGLNSEVQHPEN